MKTTDASEAALMKAAAVEWRENWRTGIASMVGMGLCLSVLPVIFSVFIQPLEEAYGWSRGEISTAKSAALLSAIASPFIGRLIDKIGVRPFMLGGMALMVFFYVLLSSMPGYLWMLYGCFIGLQVGGLATTGLGFSRVISATFPKSRGLSLAIGRSGLALSSIILPPLLYAIIAAYSWRAGFLTMAVLILFLAMPSAWFWIENKGSRHQHMKVPNVTQPTWLQLLSNWKVFVVALAAALAYVPILAIISQLKPLLMDKEVAAGAAAGLVGLIGLATFVGAIVTGILLDRYWAPLIALIMMILAAIGVGLLLIGQGDHRLVVIGVLLVGLAQGAELDIVAFVVARYFGIAVFGSVFGLTVFFISLGTAFGFPAIGYSYDIFDSYDPALAASAISLVLSGLAYLLLGRYPDDMK